MIVGYYNFLHIYYEYWVSYVCSGGGRWWSKKAIFTTNNTCVGGVTPTLVSINPGIPSCNKPVVTFNVSSLVYSSYRIARRKIGATSISLSRAFYPSSSIQSWTNGALSLGDTYEYWIIAYCANVASITTSPVSYTVCISLRQANPSNIHELSINESYQLPNGDIVQGIPFHQLPVELDMTNEYEQEINLQSMDFNSINTKDNITPPINLNLNIANTDFDIYPNPATTEAIIEYKLDDENENLQIQILDAQGKVILFEKIINPNLNGSYQLNLENYSSGIYFVKMQTANKTILKKLLVNKN